MRAFLLWALALLGAPLVQGAGAPFLSVGDRWDYSVEFAPTTDFGRNTTGSLSVRVVGYEEVRSGPPAREARGANYTTIRVESEGTWFTRTPDGFLRTVIEETKWIRPEDWALVRNITRISVFRGLSETSSGGSFVRADWDTPCPLYRFPLVEGGVWRVDCSLHLTQGGSTLSGNFTTLFRVPRKEWISEPGGTFQAFLLLNGTGDQTGVKTWFEPTVCAPVRLETYDRSGRLVYTLHLSSYSCAYAGAPFDPSRTPLPSSPTTNPRNPPVVSNPTPPTPTVEPRLRLPSAAFEGVVLAVLAATLGLSRRRV